MLPKDKLCTLGDCITFPQDIFKALSDPNRTVILQHLVASGKEHTVTELSNCCPIDLSVVSRHLKVLKEVGMVEGTKKGKEVHYKVQTAEIVDFLRNLANALENCCPVNESAVQECISSLTTLKTEQKVSTEGDNNG